MSTYRRNDSVLERLCRWIDPRLTAAKLASLVDAIRAVPGIPQTAELDLSLRASPRDDRGYRLRCSQNFTMVAVLGGSMSLPRAVAGLRVESEVRDLRDLLALVKHYGDRCHALAVSLQKTRPRLEWKVRERDRNAAQLYAARTLLHNIADGFEVTL